MSILKFDRATLTFLKIEMGNLDPPPIKGPTVSHGQLETCGVGRVSRDAVSPKYSIICDKGHLVRMIS